jgi:23S rRNA pseudouridine955/2504/2580 synthase
MRKPETLYEDDDCLVINKPAGLPVQGGRGADVNLDVILTALYSERPLLVHRLDRDTSGALLTAKTPGAAAYFSRIIAGRLARKQYLALCHTAKEPAGRKTGTFCGCLSMKGVLKDARTRYRRLAENGGFALFQLEIETGRTHQIRRHLAANNLPVLGDDKYGDFALNKRLRAGAGIKRLMLHASRLTLPLRSGGLLDVSAPVPAAFKDAMAALGLEYITPVRNSADGMTG